MEGKILCTAGLVLLRDGVPLLGVIMGTEASPPESISSAPTRQRLIFPSLRMKVLHSVSLHLQ